MANEWEWDQEYEGRRLNYLVLDGRRYGQQAARMSLRLLFWVIMLLWLIFGIIMPNWGHFGWATGGSVLEFILFCILGWRVFGAPVRDDA